jgi:hypothetical protein
MQLSTRFLVAVATTVALAGCARGTNTKASVAKSNAEPAIVETLEAKKPASPTVASQPGFENDLPRPDPGITGEGTAYESDVGEPRWRNNPGSYDDGTRPKRVTPPGNKNSIEGNRMLPPTTPGTEP